MEAVSRLADGQEVDPVASAAGGDEIAFRRIIAAYHEDMRRVCLALSGDHLVAEEAVQAAWLVAWRKLHEVRDPERLRPWLVSVAVNEAKHLLRSRQRRARVESMADPAAVAGGIDPATGIASVDLRVALRHLDPDDRALLVMRYGVGFNASELAIATGSKPAATRQRLKRLLDRLREDLDDA